MAELNKKYCKRAVFSSGQQREFLDKARDVLDVGFRDFAKLAGVHIRTVADWRRERFSMALPVLQRLCRLSGMPLPRIEVKDPFWYASSSASAGGAAVFKKYGFVGGNPVYRKERWYEWWEKEGRFKKYPVINARLPIKIPKRSPELAEFVGILLGDGHITKGHVGVTLHRIDDHGFSEYVVELFQKLFDLTPSIYERKEENVVNIVVSRSALVQFLVDIGLKVGGKVRQQVGVPSWIKQSEVFRMSCLRGLFDTDGCFYVDRHRYKIRYTLVRASILQIDLFHSSIFLGKAYGGLGFTLPRGLHLVYF